MKIHAYILCYNEIKMIRHTLNHYTSFCDQVTVLDNMSNDGTQDHIRIQFPKVIIQPWTSRNELSDAHYLKLKNKVWKKSRGVAQWVIVCDADEFLYHPDGIRNELQLRLNNQDWIPEVDGYNMVSDKFPDDYSLPIYEQVKQGVEAKHFGKRIVFNPYQVIEINYGPGAHTCTPVLRSSGKIDPHPLNLLHFKYMGSDYVKQRHAMYADRMSYENRKLGYGAEYLKGPEFVDECFQLLNEKDKLRRIIP